jgi:hypothetical protein
VSKIPSAAFNELLDERLHPSWAVAVTHTVEIMALSRKTRWLVRLTL